MLMQLPKANTSRSKWRWCCRKLFDTDESTNTRIHVEVSCMVKSVATLSQKLMLVGAVQIWVFICWYSRTAISAMISTSTPSAAALSTALVQRSKPFGWAKVFRGNVNFLVAVMHVLPGTVELLPAGRKVSRWYRAESDIDSIRTRNQWRFSKQVSYPLGIRVPFAHYQ